MGVYCVLMSVLSTINSYHFVPNHLMLSCWATYFEKLAVFFYIVVELVLPPCRLE
jgi:hypothetical protein